MRGRRRQRIAPFAGAALSCLVVGGCGGGTALTASGPAAAASRFVHAITAGATQSWCPQIGGGILGLPRQGQLPVAVLKQCEQADLFLITGGCDREAAIAGASVSSASANGARADVALSNGAHLHLRSVQGRWLIEAIVPGRSRHTPSGGRCSNGPPTTSA